MTEVNSDQVQDSQMCEACSMLERLEICI